jgi:hypothetical protein
MTRLEKNKIIKKHAICFISALILFVLFVVALIIGVSATSPLIDKIVIGFITLDLGACLFLFATCINYQTRIGDYRSNLYKLRHNNLLRIGVEALNAGNDKKAIKILSIMKILTYKTFLNAYIICTLRNGSNVVLKQKAEKLFNEIIENKS